MTYQASDFVHLHNHSCYSILDGFSKVEDMAKKAKELGQEAMAITDHGVMYGAVDFYRACKKEGIKPIIGCEVYVAPYGRTRFDKQHNIDSEIRHMVLLCKNEQGYKNLCYMVSMAFTEGFYYKPRIDLDLLKEYHEGLIASSACLAGEIPQQIKAGNYAKAKEYALLMQGIFGKDNFYLELQDHGIDEQKKVNAAILRIHDETGIPLICTNDSHYVNPEDWEAHDILLCLQTGKTIDDPNRMRYEPHNFYIRSTEEMIDLFGKYEGAIENTKKIAEMCNFDFEFGTYHLPQFDVPKGFTAATYIRHLCEKGFDERYNGKHPEYREQLDYELNMIDKMGFNEYFLIVSDFVRYAKSIGVPVGPGRGSAAGSIVSYCLYITDVEPIQYNLYFERFLNPERVAMPDIDMDFGDTRREEVVDYVRRKYGADRVAQIVTFGTMAAKGAIRDVGRVLNMPYDDVARIAKLVPNELHMTIAKAMQQVKELQTLYDQDPAVKRLLDIAMKMEGTPRNTSMHAAGVVITKDPVYSYVPLAKNSDAVVCQYNMVLLEELGLLKMDFLALRNLTILDDAIKMVYKEEDHFDINNIPLDDQDVFKMLGDGDTGGVFQMESAGITDVCVKLKPQSIEDLTAIVALYRPGPMDSIPHFIECKHDPSKVVYKHPLLEPILSNTYGVLVYQEQVIKTFQVLAGYSLGQADMVRRAMSKKKMKDIIKEREAFLHGDPERNIPGCIANGVPENVANSIYDEINAFANYAFNKAHAVCYSFIAYQTAWFKYHHPREYMASLLTSVLDTSEKVTMYIGDAKEMGVELLPPDVNHSRSSFTVDGDCVRFGLSAIKNIGVGVIDAMVKERESHGEYKSFEDFCRRAIGLGCNKRVVENLIRAGACDCFEVNRRQMLLMYGTILDNAQDEQKRNVEGQFNMFAMTEDEKQESVQYPDVKDYTQEELFAMEREVTGIYLSGHPMYEYRKDAQSLHAVPIIEVIEDFEKGAEATRYQDKQPVSVAGIISEFEMRHTKKNTMMATFNLSDETGKMPIVCFSATLDKYGYLLKDGEPILVRGRISARNENDIQVACNEVQRLIKKDELEEHAELKPEDEIIWVKIPSITGAAMDTIKDLVERFPGNDTIKVYDETRGKTVAGKCQNTFGLVLALQKALGVENVKTVAAKKS